MNTRRSFTRMPRTRWASLALALALLQACERSNDDRRLASDSLSSVKQRVPAAPDPAPDTLRALARTERRQVAAHAINWDARRRCAPISGEAPRRNSTAFHRGNAGESLVESSRFLSERGGSHGAGQGSRMRHDDRPEYCCRSVSPSRHDLLLLQSILQGQIRQAAWRVRYEVLSCSPDGCPARPCARG